MAAVATLMLLAAGVGVRPSAAQAAPVRINPGTVIVREGQEGQTEAQVPVTLSAASDLTVTVSWTTFEVPDAPPHQASPGSDYVQASGTLTFVPGQTEATVPIAIRGDLLHEADQYVVVVFHDARNAAVGGFWGLGFVGITNDDRRPVMTISSAAVSEGEGEDEYTAVALRITLSKPSELPITARWDTYHVPGAPPSQATPGVDYLPGGSLAVFPPGNTSYLIGVLVKRDAEVEPDEYFVVGLSQPVAADIGGYFGMGFAGILNDD